MLEIEEFRNFSGFFMIDSKNPYNGSFLFRIIKTYSIFDKVHKFYK